MNIIPEEFMESEGRSTAMVPILPDKNAVNMNLKSVQEEFSFTILSFNNAKVFQGSRILFHLHRQVNDFSNIFLPEAL